MDNVRTAVASDGDGRRADAGHRWTERLLTPPAWLIPAAVALFAVDEWAYQRAGASILPQAPLDWVDHLLTTMFIVWAARPWFRRGWLVPALIASVLIDADHIPQHLGSDLLTAGTARPYTHSLMTIAVLMGFASLSHRWRRVAIGAAVGVASHLWRDLAEPRGSGVALLWPVSDRTITTPANAYLGSIAALAIVATGRALAGRADAPVAADG